MANYATLKAAIQNVVKTNGNNEITGALLQQSLLAMISSLGAGYLFVGIANPSTNPGTPDQNVFYIAASGTYPNFNNLIVPDGYLGVLKYNGSWILETVSTGVKPETVVLSCSIGLTYYKLNVPIVQGKQYRVIVSRDVNGNCEISTATAAESSARVDTILEFSYFDRNLEAEFVATANADYIAIWCSIAGTYSLQIAYSDNLTFVIDDVKKDVQQTQTDIANTNTRIDNANTLIQNNADSIADIIKVLGKGTTQDVTVTTQSGRIANTGNVVTDSSCSYSAPIPVSAGDVLLLTAFVNAATLPISETDSAGSFHKPIIGVGVGNKTYICFCRKNGYLAVSYTNGNVSIKKSSLGGMITIANDLTTLFNLVQAAETDISESQTTISEIVNALGKGTTQDLETTFENGRIDGSGNVVIETGSYHSSPIQVNKGDVVIFAAWCNAATSPISLTDASGSFYTPVIGTGSGYKNYQYIALNDGYVAFSYSVSSTYPDVTAQKTTLSSLLSLINALNQLTERVDNLEGSKDYQTMFPSYVFGIESGTFNGREYATAIYPEAITKARIFPEQSQGEDTDRSQTYIRINNGKRLLLQKPKQDSYSYNHFNTPIEVIAKDAFVSGDGLMKKTFSFNYIRANRKNGQNKNMFVLLIGASITQQGGYPGYLQMLADMDNADIGNLNIKVLGSNVGTVTPSITYEYNGQTKTIVTHTEGRAGWPTLALANWPFEARLDGATDTLGAMGMWYAAGMATKTPYDSTTPGQSFESWSGTNTQKCALFGAVFGRYKPDYCADLWNALHNFHTRYRSGAHTIWYYSTGAEYITGATIPAYNGNASDTIMAQFFDDLCYNPDNVFYDRDRARAYTGSHIWTNKTAFSIAKWVERYRTLDDNGNQLTLGNGTGTFVTSSNINNPVCTPTIIFNGMGANDLVGMAYGDWNVIDGTYNTVKESILDFLNDIHAQMPTVPLGWGVPRQSGVFFPEDWDEIGIIPQITYYTIHRDWLNNLMMPEFEALSQNNDCNYIPIYYTSSPVSGQSPHYVGDFDRRKPENADLVVTGADLGHVGKEWECSVAYQILAWMYWAFQ